MTADNHRAPHVPPWLAGPPAPASGDSLRAPAAPRETAAAPEVHGSSEVTGPSEVAASPEGHASAESGTARPDVAPQEHPQSQGAHSEAARSAAPQPEAGPPAPLPSWIPAADNEWAGDPVAAPQHPDAPHFAPPSRGTMPPRGPVPPHAAPNHGVPPQSLPPHAGPLSGHPSKANRNKAHPSKFRRKVAHPNTSVRPQDSGHPQDSGCRHSSAHPLRRKSTTHPASTRNAPPQGA